MYRNLKNAFALTTLALLGLASAANAQNAFFPNDATINYAIPGAAYIGFADSSDEINQTNPTSPTVSLVPGGSISYLDAYNSSTVNVSGGLISYVLSAHNSSKINVSGGNIGSYLEANASSTVNVSGGSIYSNLDANNSSTVNVSGGNIGYLEANDSGILNIYGSGLTASLVNPNYFDDSQYDLSGTLLDGTVYTNKNLFIQNGTCASFHLFNTATPAPSSVLVVALGAVPLVGVLRKRRK